jgi:SlyX protein
MNADDAEKRLVEIETKLAFAENLLDELNAVVYRQQKEIDALREALRQLRDQVEASASPEPLDAGDEKPPHY